MEGTRGRRFEAPVGKARPDMIYEHQTKPLLDELQHWY
jgi:hypothetical protein